MKILHTSDWHLGRTFHGRVLDDAQEAFADFLVELAEAEAVDAVVIAGDVYDRAVPPTSAVLLLNDTLRRLAERTRVILTPGNHDSATRLGFASSLLRPEVAVRAQAARVGEPVLVPDREGGTGAYVYALPFLDPYTAGEELAPALADQLEQEPATSSHPAPTHLARSHEAVVSGALRLVGADLARRRATAARRLPAVVMAHAFVSGGHASPDSERDLRVGGVESVPAGIFTDLGGSPHARASGGVDYVALGHLHRPQEIRVPSPGGPPGTTPTAPGGPDESNEPYRLAAADTGEQPRVTAAPRLVYAGSPLPFSFSEADVAKSVALVDLAGSGVTRVERIATPVPHPVVTVTGSVAELLSPTTSVPAGAWVRAVVDGVLAPGDQARLREHLGEVLAITVQAPAPSRRPRPAVSVSAVADPVEVAARFLEDVSGSAPGEEERSILTQAYEAVLAAARSK